MPHSNLFIAHIKEAVCTITQGNLQNIFTFNLIENNKMRSHSNCRRISFVNALSLDESFSYCSQVTQR